MKSVTNIFVTVRQYAMSETLGASGRSTPGDCRPRRKNSEREQNRFVQNGFVYCTEVSRKCLRVWNRTMYLKHRNYIYPYQSDLDDSFMVDFKVELFIYTDSIFSTHIVVCLCQLLYTWKTKREYFYQLFEIEYKCERREYSCSKIVKL